MSSPDKPQDQAHLKSGRRKSFASARWLAFLAIKAFALRGAFVSKVLDEDFREHDTEPRDRRLATELANEVIRRRFTLDAILRQYVDRPRESVQDELWIVLQLGVLQLVFLEHVLPHAAVNETVELCNRLRLGRAKGFVNGILRSLEREIECPETASPGPVAETAHSDQRSSSTFPVASLFGGRLSVRSVKLSRPILADPSQDFTTYISQVVSLPHWLIERWLTQFGDPERVFDLGLWFTTSGRMSLRVNLTQTTRERTLEVLQAAEVIAAPGRFSEGIDLAGTVAVGNLPGFREGWFSVQDESAMAAVDLLDPRPGERILDLCAAPGGKTCHLAERLRRTGSIVASDISESRLQSVKESVSRLKLTNVETQLLTPEGEWMLSGSFDAVLVDVPCSNTGVLGKRPEARWRISPASFERLVPQQRELLERGISLLKPGGRIVYSTCSIDRIENEEVVHPLLRKHPDVRLISEQTHWPGAPADGGYQALLTRSDAEV